MCSILGILDLHSDPAALRATVEEPTAGAFVAFEGWVRNHNEGEAVRGLHYEVYPELALTAGEAVLAEARERFDIVAIHAVHAYGELAIGDLAVWVGVSAAHREAASSIASGIPSSAETISSMAP